jgi:uncharacterized membrane protein
MSSTNSTVLQWHRVVVVVSVLTVIGVLLPGSDPVRQVLGGFFVVFVPGMAVAGRSRHLRRHGMFSAEAFAVVVPISFAVGVAGTLLMAYLLPWSPTSLLIVTAAATTWSSIQQLSTLRTSAANP